MPATTEKQATVDNTLAPEGYLTVQEAADFLHLAVQSLYDLTSRGEVPFEKPNKTLLFKKSALQEYVTKRSERKQARKQGLSRYQLQAAKDVINNKGEVLIFQQYEHEPTAILEYISFARALEPKKKVVVTYDFELGTMRDAYAQLLSEINETEKPSLIIVRYLESFVNNKSDFSFFHKFLSVIAVSKKVPVVVVSKDQKSEKYINE